MSRDPKSRPHLIDRIREQLHSELGGECSECRSTTQLEIDHPWGRDWVPRQVSSYQRWLRYRREHQQGLVRLLCKECNERIRPRAQEHVTMEPMPF
jgi:hypothetical protein